jgi:hypothetical protein
MESASKSIKTWTLSETAVLRTKENVLKVLICIANNAFYSIFFSAEKL